MAMVIDWDNLPVEIEMIRQFLYCDYTLPYIGSIRSHTELECRYNNRRCVCKECSKEFTTKKGFDRHILLIHFTSCLKYVTHTFYQSFYQSFYHVCHYKDVNKKQVLIHITYIVSQVEFKCYHCHRTFDRKLDLITHFNNPDEKGPYECSGCAHRNPTKLRYDRHVLKRCQNPEINLKHVTTCSIL